MAEATAGYVCVTEGLGASLVNHVFVEPRLAAEGVELLDAVGPAGRALSDHAGVHVTLRRR